MVIGSDFSVGLTVSFECLPGYSLLGEASLTCVHGTSRDWNHPVPRCEGSKSPLAPAPTAATWIYFREILRCPGEDLTWG